MKLFSMPILIMILGMMVLGCKKEMKTDPDALPAETQTGSIMFACRMNGTKWMPAKKMDVDGSFDGNLIRIKGSVFLADAFEGLDIEIKNPGARRSFLLAGSAAEAAVFFSSNRNCFDGPTGYGLGQARSSVGTLVLTKFDTEKKIISGTFSCQIPTDRCGVLKVTEGRFDVRYY